MIIVILAVLFLGAAAGDWESGLNLRAYGGGITLVILVGSVAVLIFRIGRQWCWAPIPLAVQYL